MTEAWSIAHRIGERAASQPLRAALTVDGETLSYAELWRCAARIADRLREGGEGDATPATAVLAHRHLSSYLGILACLIGGHAWVPLHVDHPARRNLAVLRKSRAGRVVCGPHAAAALEGLRSEDRSLVLEVIEAPDRKGDVQARDAVDLPASIVPASRRAYVLFTSGSTGEPKGVPITHGALTAYLEAASRLVPCGADDRCSQTFELTFDLSIHDLLMCWTAGAHLVVPTRAELARPAEYVRRHAITRWFSVPSLAYQMRLQGDLVPGAFPGLRSSLFCGEALPLQLAHEWALAAPASVVENWYGPTEATIACARWVVPRASAGPVSTHDLAPIGDAFDGMTLSIHAADLSPLPDGTPGELLLRGRQLSEGYLDEPERNARTFVRLPDAGGAVAYRTGDRAVREPGGPVHFLGRLDNQVKVRGFRIELTEIEAVLRTATGGANAVALSWPPQEPSGRFIVAAIESATVDGPAVVAAIARSLPDYMVPAHVVALPSFPVNASGKADRREIARQVEVRLRVSAEPADLEQLPAAAQRLMRAVLTVSPTLSTREALEADTLMAAGMDSLSFIALTAEIERLYGRALDQDEVVRLSLLSFDDIVAWLERRRRPPPAWSQWLERLLRRGPAGERIDRRTNRALQFIVRFPGVLAAARGRALVLALGSSGTFRAVSPDDFEAEARRLGHDVECYNAGLAGVSVAGIARLAKWVASLCRRARVHPAVVLYELDPAQVSVLPGRGDARLPDAFFSGAIEPYPDGHFTTDFEWSAEARGAWVHDLPATTAKRKANWERERDTEVARIYAGDVPFVPSSFDAWAEGLRALQEVAGRVVVFVHPVNAAMLQELPARFRGDRFDALLRRISAMDGVELLAPDGFELEDADYLDINHVNPGAGRPKLSRQLAQRVLTGSRAMAPPEGSGRVVSG